MIAHRVAWSVLFLFSATSSGVFAAELAPPQRAKLESIDRQLQRVVALYRDHKIDDLKKLADEIESGLDELAAEMKGDSGFEPLLTPFRTRLAAARKLATLTPSPSAPGVAARPTNKSAATGPPAEAAKPAGVSFIKEIVPVLVGRCNTCHVVNARGDLNMNSYAKLMTGVGGTRPVVKPGDAANSPLLQKIAAGEMPLEGEKCSPAEIAIVSRWIAEGAKFDGPDEAASLRSFLPKGRLNPDAKPVITLASGDETVRFVRDVAPILMDNCFQCHGASSRPNDAKSDFLMRTYFEFLSGGQNNARPITPGDAEGSYLVQVLRGKAKAFDGVRTLNRMPNRQPPLDESDLQTILTWINEGAKFDDQIENVDVRLDYLIEAQKAKRASHEELAALRLERAKRDWGRANPESPPEIIETPEFTIFGDLGTVRLREFADQVEEERQKLVAALKLPTDRPLVNGRITLLAFDKEFEYFEFGRLVEERSLLKEQAAHWRFDFIDCYGAIIVQSTQAQTAPLISESLAGAYFDALGSVAPRWFAVGAARNIVAKIHRGSPLVRTWEDRLPAARSTKLEPKEILETESLDLEAAALAQGFVKELMKAPSWNTLMTAISQGARFENAFEQAFHTDPLPLFTAWMQR